MPYFLRTECGRPQILQRVYARVLYLGVLCCLFIIAFLAIMFSLILKRHTELGKQYLGFLIGFGSRDDVNVKASDLFDKLV